MSGRISSGSGREKGMTIGQSSEESSARPGSWLRVGSVGIRSCPAAELGGGASNQRLIYQFRYAHVSFGWSNCMMSAVMASRVGRSERSKLECLRMFANFHKQGRERDGSTRPSGMREQFGKCPDYFDQSLRQSTEYKLHRQSRCILNHQLVSHLMLMPAFKFSLPVLSPESPFLPVFISHTFQNLRFSSAAAVATWHPSGLIADERIRDSCAGRSQIFDNDGKDQTQMLLFGKPCVDSNSLACGDQMSEVTCVAVSRVFVRVPVVDDQKLIF